MKKLTTKEGIVVGIVVAVVLVFFGLYTNLFSGIQDTTSPSADSLMVQTETE